MAQEGMISDAELEKMYRPGLEDVPVCKSSVGFVDGIEGILEYRGFPIEELAEHSTFEETCYLLLKGQLPSQSGLEAFRSVVRGHLELNPKVIRIIQTFPSSGHPMNALQTGVAALGMFYPFPAKPIAQDHWDAAMRLIAKVPMLIGAFQRHRLGLKPVDPDMSMGIAGNMLYAITGKMPTPEEIHIMDVCLILHAEHTLNASTFTSRAISSTLADPYTAISGAIGSLSGPLHGGANEEVLKMLREVGSVENVRPYVEEKVAKKEKIMGMGHRVYKTKDPRANILQKIAKKIFQTHHGEGLLPIAEELEKVCLEKLSSKGIYPNVDFYSGLVYNRLGIAEDLLTCLFAAARTPGWLAHSIEQLDGNRIFRPTQIYTGTHNQKYVPIGNR